MIVRTLDEIIGTARHAKGPGWESRRILLKSDGMGYSVHDTLIPEGSEMELEYKHHLETNYYIAGEGEVVDVATGKVWPLKPGSMYALDQHDRHILRATKGDLRLVCVFNPPLSGEESHNADGSYADPDATEQG